MTVARRAIAWVLCELAGGLLWLARRVEPRGQKFCGAAFTK